MSSLPHFNGTRYVYTFVGLSVNRRNDEVPAPKCGHCLHYSVSTRIQTYTEPVLLKCGKLDTKYHFTVYGKTTEFRGTTYFIIPSFLVNHVKNNHK